MRKALILGLLTLALAACSTESALPMQDVPPLATDPAVSVALVSVQASSVTVKISSTHFTVVPAAEAANPHKYGEGQYHLFLDIPPTAPGEVIPDAKGIYATSDSVYTINDVPNGHHKLWVVLSFSDNTPYQAVSVTNAAVSGSTAALDFVVNGSNFTAPVASPVPSQVAVAPSAGPTATASSGGGGATIKISVQMDPANQGKFVPPSVTIHVGDTVKWTFDDGTNGPHTATSDDGSTFDSQAKGVSGDQGTSYSFTFTKAGSYPYHCTFHANMTAKITVS